MPSRGNNTGAKMKFAPNAQYDIFPTIVTCMVGNGFGEEADALTTVQKALLLEDANLFRAVSRLKLGRCKRTRFMAVCNGGDLDRVQLLLARTGDATSLVNAQDRRKYTALVAAISNGHTAVVECLLGVPGIDPTAADNQAIRCASVLGHAHLVQILLANARVDPCANDNDAVRRALMYGHAGVVRLLLADARVDAKAVNIGQACLLGHIDVVRLLLTDVRVNPAQNDNRAIGMASFNGYLEIVRLLLTDARVNPAADNNAAIRMAAGQGHASVVQHLLTDARVDPAADNNAAIRDASVRGHAGVVQLLLADARVDPAAGNNAAIRDGHAGVVQLLLANARARVDPVAQVLTREMSAADDAVPSSLTEALCNDQADQAVLKFPFNLLKVFETQLDRLWNLLCSG